MRTPGRRYFESHWHIRLGGFIAISALAVASWFTYGRVQQLQNYRHNPHYETDHCFDCHESNNSKMKPAECFKCHDMLTRNLLPNAYEDRAKIRPQPCSHPIKMIDPVRGRTVTSLCLSCHKGDKALVAMVNIDDSAYVEIDVTATHPIGLKPTEHVFPKTLPLSLGGEIDCTTCHDHHATDKRLHLLRLFHPGNGRPADFRPLCNDCHEPGWMPVGKKTIDSVGESDRLRGKIRSYKRVGE